MPREARNCCLPPGHGVDQRARLVVAQRSQRGEPLAMPGEPHGDDRHRGHLRGERRQLEHRALQRRPIVPVGAQHDLGVHADARPGQPLQPRQDLRRVAGAAEQGMAQRGVGGVHRDVEGREPLLEDASEGVLGEIAQGDVVAVKERQPKVVVLHVEATPHPLRELMDEAEDALVGAGGDLAGPRRVQFQTEVSGAAHQGEAPAPARALHLHLQHLVARVKLEIDGVAQRLTVDGQQAIPGGQARRGGGRPRPHGGHHHPLSG